MPIRDALQDTGATATTSNHSCDATPPTSADAGSWTPCWARSEGDDHMLDRVCERENGAGLVLPYSIALGDLTPE